jgi:hypothetical protein
VAVSESKSRRHSAGVAAARCRHDGDFRGVQGACQHVHHVQLCCQEASGNKPKFACTSTHGGLKSMQKLIPQTHSMHMCVCSDLLCFLALPNCCVWLLACSHATTTRETKLHHRCHEPVTTAHGCICDRLLLPRAGLAAQDARLRGCRRSFDAAAGLLPPVVAAADSISVTHLCTHIWKKVLTCMPA